ncbi:cytochrome P450 [Daedaleopsis nitida]|nr:cytochrome P450 [Daedaleopsis nitida]
MQAFDKDAWGFHRELMEKYGTVAVLRAPLGNKWLLVSDPVALNRIFTRDQAMYEEPSWFTSSNSMFVGDGLLSVTGDVHRKQRKMLTPVFSIKYLKEITPIFSQVTTHLIDALASLVTADSGTEVEIVGWMGRTALELIGQAGLGCSIDPLTNAAPDPLASAAKEFSTLAFAVEMLAIRRTIPFLRKLGPPQFRRWLLDRIPIPNVQRLKASIDTLYGRSSEIVAESKRTVEKARAGGHEDESTKILISVLLQANMDAAEEDRMPDNQVVGQMTWAHPLPAERIRIPVLTSTYARTLLFAAMDTTSNALSRTLHLLSLHPNVQAKLRREVLDATTNGLNVSYDNLHNQPYLDAVCRETLRL